MSRMTSVLGIQGLNHDPWRLAMTASGLALAMALVILQLGLIAGFARMISGALDHADADLWIVPPGSAAFDDASRINTGASYIALQDRSVARVTELMVGFAEWRAGSGASNSVIVIGADPRDRALLPWNLAAGTASSLLQPEAVAIDSFYMDQLGIGRLGDQASIEGRQVRVTALTSGIRSFTTSPYVFTSLSSARELLEMPGGQATYLAVKLAPGADPMAVRDRIATRLGAAEVLTTAEFRARNLSRWLLETGAGAALLGGALIGFCVGAFIVGQTIYASIRDNQKQFATLRAMGASGQFLASTVLWHAAVTTVLAALLASAASWAIIEADTSSALPVAMPAGLVAALAALLAIMVAGSAGVAILKVVRLEPASVLGR